jgi:hypothetical protein
MQWEFIVALVVAIPVILFPVAFVWFLNIAGVVRAVRGARTAREKKAAAVKTTNWEIPDKTCGKEVKT